MCSPSPLQFIWSLQDHCCLWLKTTTRHSIRCSSPDTTVSHHSWSPCHQEIWQWSWSCFWPHSQWGVYRLVDCSIHPWFFIAHYCYCDNNVINNHAGKANYFHTECVTGHSGHTQSLLIGQSSGLPHSSLITGAFWQNFSLFADMRKAAFWSDAKL